MTNKIAAAKSEMDRLRVVTEAAAELWNTARDEQESAAARDTYHYFTGLWMAASDRYAALAKA